MLLSALPKNELPVSYADHFLFYEKLEQPWHCDEQPAALGLLMAGNGECDYFVNGAKNRVHTNQLFLVNRDSRLAVHIAKKESAPALLFFHSKLPELVRHSMEESSEKLLEEKTSHQYDDFSFLERMHNNPALHETISSLVALGSSCSSFASLKADIMIRNLFEQLLRENRSAASLSKNLAAVKASTRLEIFKRVALAKEWMEANYASGCTLEELAMIANMNSQHFLRMFSQVYQITPHQYLIGIKLEKAKELLQSTSLTVLEICNAIGFESVYSFSLLFKRKFGPPPAQLRTNPRNLRNPR